MSLDPLFQISVFVSKCDEKIRFEGNAQAKLMRSIFFRFYYESMCDVDVRKERPKVMMSKTEGRLKPQRGKEYTFFANSSG